MKKYIAALWLLLMAVLWIGVPAAATEGSDPQPHVHTVESWTVSADGHSGECTGCGQTVTEAHTLDQGVAAEAPTCQKEGKTVYTCSCGYTYEESVPKLTDHVYGGYTADQNGHARKCIHCDHSESAAHTWDAGVITTERTCTVDGVKTFTCTVCQHTRVETTAASGHSYGAWKNIDETYHQRTCSCGATERVKHSWNSGVVTTQPTCDKLGVKTFTCTGCRTTKTSNVSKLPHTYDHSCDVSCNICDHIRRTVHQYETKWTTDEVNHWHECSVCGDDGDLQAHIPTDWILDFAEGEFTDGQKHRDCSICGLLLKTEVIPATGCLHGNEELRNTKDPTCTETGYTGDWVCPRCQEVVTAGEEIPLLPHETQLENQKASTCTEEGYTGDHICQNCRTVVTAGEAVEKLAHTPQLQNSTEPTCTEEGYTGDEICQVCQTVVEEGQAVEKLPHQTALENEADRTCTSDGYTGDQVCGNCGSIVEQGSVIPAAGHRFEEGICLDCMQEDPDYVPPASVNPGVIPDVDYEVPEAPKMSPMIIACIAILGITGVGLVVLIILVAKKK